MSKKNIYTCIIISLMAAINAFAEKNIYILVHGTWGTRDNWHQVDSQFFCNLTESAQGMNGKVIVYNWTGKLNHLSRISAGINLAQLISSYQEDTQINIIAHSHGANVAIIASKILGKNKKNKYRISKIYALGGPVDTKNYMPNMEVIKYYYNFFSFNDVVQPVFGLYERVFPSHERIANIKIELNGRQPTHTQIPSPAIAKWLPYIHENCPKDMDTFVQFNFLQPSTIEFYDNEPPVYLKDIRREQELTIDRTINKQKIPEFDN